MLRHCEYNSSTRVYLSHILGNVVVVFLNNIPMRIAATASDNLKSLGRFSPKQVQDSAGTRKCKAPGGFLNYQVRTRGETAILVLPETRQIGLRLGKA